MCLVRLRLCFIFLSQILHRSSGGGPARPGPAGAPALAAGGPALAAGGPALAAGGPALAAGGSAQVAGGSAPGPACGGWRVRYLRRLSLCLKDLSHILHLGPVCSFM